MENSNAYRLISSEADLLPGLIVDRYGPYLVMQTLNQGMDRARDVIVDCLTELLQPSGILARNDASVRKLEGLPLERYQLAGEIPERVAIEMNGLKLEADLLHGQKTGIYLDQRENYVAAARYARGRVLDCFTSTGGFALHIARACGVGGGDRLLCACALPSRRRTPGPTESRTSSSVRRTCSIFSSGSTAATR